MTTLPPRARQQGSMLIVALAVLTLLSLIAVTFASLMRLERKATINFRNLRRTEQLAGSAESSVIAMLRGGLFWDGYTTWHEKTSPWIYGVREGQPMYGRRSLEDAKPGETSYAWFVTATYPRGHDYFKTKIIDTSSQINLNSEQDTLAEMIDNLGVALKADYRWGKNPFFSGPNESGDRISGRRVMEFRSKLPGRKFVSKRQLEKFLGSENYAIAADFLTCHSWVDGTVYASGDGSAKNRNFGGENTTAVPGGEEITTPGMFVRSNLTPELRAPININTAPEPVLIACLQGLGCRRPFPFVTIERQRTEEANRGNIDVDDGTLPPTDEELIYRSEPIWVFGHPLEYDHARRMAQAIVAKRKETPFRVWQAARSEKGGFEEFINREIKDDFFPRPNTIKARRPLKGAKASTRYVSALLNRGLDVGRVFTAGHGSNASFRRNEGMSFSPSHAWYYDMMRGMLSANFNPNTRIANYNPNHTVYTPVDKYNLVKLEETGSEQGRVRPGHTVEFCFDSMGIYEVTTVAQITAHESDASLYRSDEEDDIEVSAENDYAGQARFGQVQQRSIVKVFEVLRHTTQAHFEQPFTSGGSFNSVSSRKYVTTYPDPMDLLHLELWQGSHQDGRVELIGRVDGMRQNLSAAERSSAPYAGKTSFLLYCGFRFREEGSTQRLFRIGKRTRTDPQFAVERRRVLDPSFARAPGNLAKRYSQDYWQSASDSDIDITQMAEPQVDTADRGDFYPDGLSSSVFRSPPGGFRYLHLPAMKYRTRRADQGAAYTHSNESGNLPYYSGGVAFWVKFMFDGSDPVFCGLLGATQVQSEVGASPDDSEGTQFFVWKNTTGELRVSRLYYHQAFLRGATDQAVPAVGEDEDPNSEDITMDGRKVFARTDVGIDIRGWKAHEWHHIGVEYRDDANNNRIRVFLDFEEAFGWSNDMGEEKFCALNVEEPKDGIVIGGIFRQQASANEGLFKFNTQQDDTGVDVGERVKRMSSNATIDEFVTFTGGFRPAFGSIGYFTEKTGVYTNRFRVQLPEGIQRVRLRSFAWTAYRPKSYQNAPVLTQAADFQAFLIGVDQSVAPQRVSDAGGNALLNQATAGRWIYAKGTLQDRIGEVLYQFKMRSARGSEKYGARFVASPVLDDVTLTYYLPSAQVLLTETD